MASMAHRAVDARYPYGMDDRVTIVMATRNRRNRALATIQRLAALPGDHPIVVVDDAGTDGTAAAVRARFPDVDAIRLEHNLGAAARNVGVRRATTPYVAFADDDSWWAEGSLERAADVLDATPNLGLLAARIVVEPEGRVDPVCEQMRASPLRPPDLPGPRIVGFVCCGAVVRRGPFLSVGGFHERLGIGGEEDLLALDLDGAGWRSAYVDEVCAHHEPAERGPRPDRRRRLARNELWTAWLRRHPSDATRITVRCLAGALRDPAAMRGIVEAVGGVPWVVGARVRAPVAAEEARRAVERLGARDVRSTPEPDPRG